MERTYASDYWGRRVVNLRQVTNPCAGMDTAASMTTSMEKGHLRVLCVCLCMVAVTQLWEENSKACILAWGTLSYRAG